MRYLIVGFGNIGHKRAAVLGKKFVASFDPNPKAIADYKDLEDIPNEIYDTAVLTVPQQNKVELTEHFLKLNKNVLVEKPLMLNKAQVKRIADAIKKSKGILVTSYNHRFEPNIVRIERLMKDGTLGKLYHARFVYSFGNIKERIGTWRETEFGVLEEIVPHQIDFAFRFFGYKGKDFETLIARKVESKIFDHWLITTKDRKLIIECGAVTWKYVFSMDIYYEKGSVHMEGLRKWGGSELIIRKRVLPSGAPKEKRVFDSGPDLTWKKDFAYFEKLVKEKRNTFDNDLEMSMALGKLSREARKQWKNH